MATLPVPLTNTTVQAQLGLAAQLVPGVTMQLADRLDVVAPGIVRLVVDMAGTGSNVGRVRYAGGLGFQAPLQALASDTDAPPDATPAAGYTSITLAPFGLGMSQSFMSRVLADSGASEAMSLEAFARQVPDSWAAMARAQTCTVGAAFATRIGSSSVPMSVDLALSLIAALESTDGGVDMPLAPVMLHPTQLEQLRASARSEPAFQAELAAFEASQQASRRMRLAGLDFAATSSVTTSGGAYKGFAFHQGGIGYGVAGATPANLPIPQGSNPVYIPEFGLVMYERLNALGQQLLGINALAFVGFAAGDASVYFLRGFDSAT
jgi:hypothetical protein